MKKRVLSLLLAMVMIVGMLPAAAFAEVGDGEEGVTISVTISNDGMPLMGNDEDETVIANLEITVPYFELEPYGLDDYDLYKEAQTPTVLHAYIYLLERYYMGLDEEECCTGKSGLTDYDEETTVYYMDGTEAYENEERQALYITGSSGSMYMANFWGHDENLMYFLNHAYPLMYEGWGATADTIQLNDGDVIDLAMFSDWNFWGSGAFCFFDQDLYEIEAGDTVTTTTWKAATMAGLGGESKEPETINTLNVAVYNDQWEQVAALTGEDGTYSYTFETGGTYYLLGQDPNVKTDDACYAPAVAKVVVEGAKEPVGYLSSLEFTEYGSVSNKGEVYKLDPVFNGLTYDYTLLLPDYMTNANCWASLGEGVPEDSVITVQWTNLYNDKPMTSTVINSVYMANFGRDMGTNTAKLTVGVDGDQQVYTVKSVRTPTLASLNVEGGYMDKSFAASTTAYAVETNAESVTINADPYQDSYTVTYNGGDDNEIALKEGENEVVVVVSNGTYSRSYTLIINRHGIGTIGITAEPEEALIHLVDSYSNRVLANEDGRFEVTYGYDYTCTVTAPGYEGQKQSFTAASDMEDLTFALVEAEENETINTEIEAEWPNFRNGEKHLGITESKTPTTAEETELLWAAKYGSGWAAAPGSPILVDDYLITYVSKTIKKLDVNTGEVVAENDMVAASSFAIVPPTYADGMIFVGLSGGRIQAFNAETLESLWVYTDPLGGQPNCPITYSDGYVYAGFWNSENKDANFACVNVTDEDPNQTTEAKLSSWTVTRTGGFYWTGAYASDKFVVVGTDDGQSGSTTESSSLLVLNKKDGTLVDSWDGIRGDIRSNVSYDPESDRVFFTSKGGVLCNAKIDWETGKITDTQLTVIVNAGKLEYAMSTCTPSVYNGRIYIGTAGGGNFTGKGFCIAVYELAADGTMTQAYTYGMPGYPQTSAMVTTAYMEDEGCVYIYLPYNAQPGGISVLRDKPGQTAPDAVGDGSYSEVFTPAAPLSQYCICSTIADSYGTIYYKNDSCYMMALTSKILGLEITQQPSAVLYDENGNITGTIGLKAVCNLANGLQRDVSDYVTYDIRDGVKSVVYTYGLDHANYGLKEQTAVLVDPADTVIEMIDAIGEVTLKSRDAIMAAEKAYKALPEEAKACMTNYDVLLAARAAYDELLDNLLPPVGPSTSGKPSQPEQPEQPEQSEEPEVPSQPAAFTDVSENDWFAEGVEYACENGLMNGTGDGKFAPYANTTRGMIVTILARMDGVNTDGGSSWYASGRQWAIDNGISDGTNMTGEITLEQLATMLYRYAQIKGYDTTARASLNAFSDASSVSDWAVEAMEWAVGMGLIQGSNGQLAPNASANRAQVAVILMRFEENAEKIDA